MSMPDRTHFPPQMVLTVGHSNRPLEEFLRLLQAHGATLVVDVRKMPGSRRNPQFGRDTLPPALQQAGIGYDYADALRQLGRFLDAVYNHQRIHSALGYLTPAEFERQWLSQQPA